MSADEALASKRSILAEARRATQAKVVSAALAGTMALRLFRDTPWLIVAGAVVAIGLPIRWIAGYRRLRRELGLEDEYDELDENASNATKTLLILFGVFGGMFALILLLITVLKR